MSRPVGRLVCVLLLLHSASAFAYDVTTESGFFQAFDGDTETNYTLILPVNAADRSGNLYLITPPVSDLLHGPLSQSGQAAEANRWLAEEYGFVVGSVDYGDHTHRGWNIEDQVELSRKFAEWVKAQHGLAGKVFVKGSGHGAWVALAALILEPDTFAGAVAAGAVADLAGHNQYLHYSLHGALGMSDWPLASHRIRAINSGAASLGGPFVDRHTGEKSSQVTRISPGLRAADFYRPAVIRHGDSDLYVHPGHLWKLIDNLRAIQPEGRRTFIAEMMIGRGQQAPAEEDVAGERRWSLLVERWASGQQVDPVPGTVIAQRDVGAVSIPKIENIYEISAAAEPERPGMLSIKSRLGAGTGLCAFGSAAVVGKFQGCENLCVVFGSFSGFLHEVELAGKKVVERWRSRHFGAPVTGLGSADVDGDGKTEIVAAFADGHIRVISTDDLELTKNETRDGLGAALLDVFALDVDGSEQSGPAEIIARSADGYIFVYDGKTLARRAMSQWLGGTLWTGMDVGDLDGDGTVKIVAGDAEGYVRILDAATLDVLKTSGYLGFYPNLVRMANLSVQPEGAEIFVNGSVAGWGGMGVSLILDRELAELRRIDDTETFFSLQRNDSDQDGLDEIILGASGGVAYADTAPQGVNPSFVWQAPDIGPVTAVAASDFDGDRKTEVLAISLHGSVHFLDANRWSVDAQLDGAGGTFGVATHDTDGNGKDEVFAGSRSAGVRLFSGESLEASLPVSGFAHAVEVGDVDADGKPEVFVGTGERAFESRAGYVHAYRMDGSKIWSTEAALGENGPVWGLKLADVDGDGSIELVAGNELTIEQGERGWASLYVFNAATGELRASKRVVAHDLFALEVTDIDWDQKMEILTGDRRGYFMAFSYDGQTIEQELLTAGAIGGRIGDLEAVDLNNNGRPELLVGDETGKLLHIKYEDGVMVKIAETADLGTHVWGVLSDDFDADGEKEVAAGNAAGSLFVFDSSLRRLLGRIDGLGSFVGAYGSLKSAEVDGDPQREIIASGGGYLYVIDVNVEQPGLDGGGDGGPDASIVADAGMADGGLTKLRGGGGCKCAEAGSGVETWWLAVLLGSLSMRGRIARRSRAICLRLRRQAICKDSVRYSPLGFASPANSPTGS